MPSLTRVQSWAGTILDSRWRADLTRVHTLDDLQQQRRESGAFGLAERLQQRERGITLARPLNGIKRANQFDGLPLLHQVARNALCRSGFGAFSAVYAYRVP